MTETLTFERITIEEEMERSYLEYAMSVIVSRALPDVRDGLKPVHRRILYAMHDGGYDSSKAYRKCARIVGEVLGKYHPHGENAVYDAVVRMVQSFSMRMPLIDGQGNFGSMDGDRAAAMRYTEVRLSKAAELLLEDIDKNTVDFQPNYDTSLQEPLVLPTRLPNLLVNGSSGIAVGMATNIPPHNLGEICALCYRLLESPQTDLESLIKELPGPDFPTGALIIGRRDIEDCYRHGRGSITMRARSAIEPMRANKSRLVFTEVPYQSNKARIIERIAELVREKKITGIADLRDESDRSGLRIAIELKTGVDAKVVRSQIFKHTTLQTRFNVQLLALQGGRPRLMNLKDILVAFLEFRDEVLRRRTQFLLDKARARLHILFGLLIAIADIDAIVALIRGSHSLEEARAALLARVFAAEPIAALVARASEGDSNEGIEIHEGTCRLTAAQCQTVLELRLQRLVALEREKLFDEAHKLLDWIADYKDILASKQRRALEIKADLERAEKQLGNPRRTDILPEEADIDAESLIPREDVVITLTKRGYLKRVASRSYRSQHRGGKGRVGMSIREEDALLHVCFATTRARLLFFTSRGMVYSLPVAEIPEGSPQAGGKGAMNLLPLAEAERITSLQLLPETPAERKDKMIVLATASGTVRRNRIEDFSEIMRNGKIAMKLRKGDSLIGTVVCNESSDLFLASRKGKAIRFAVRRMRLFRGRDSIGVRGISLATDDRVVSVAAVAAEAADKLTMLTAVDQGFGKRTKFSEYRLTSRGGLGVKNILLPSSSGSVIASFPVSDRDCIDLFSNQGQFMRIEAQEVRTCGRSTRGVRLFDLKEGARLVAVGHIPEAHAEGQTEEEDEENGKQGDST